MIILMVMLVGCEGNRISDTDNDLLKKESIEDVSADNNNTEENVDELVKRKGKTAIKMYILGTEPEGFKEVVNEIYKKCSLDIVLDFKWFREDEYFIMISAGLESNKLTGVFCEYIGLWEIRKEREILELDELLPKYAPNIYNQLKQDDSLNLTMEGDKMILLPRPYKAPSKLLVRLDKDIVDDYNIDKIETIEDYIKILYTIKDGYNKKPVYIHPRFILSILAIKHGYIVLDGRMGLVYKLDDPEMKIIPIEELPEFKKMLMIFNNAYRDGVLSGDIKLPRSEHSDIYIGDSIVSRDDRAITTGNGNLIIDKGSEQQYTFALYPDKKVRSISSKSNSIVFTKSQEDTEIALKFFDWVQESQENYDLLNYGLEGIHYTLDNNKINIIKKFNISQVFSNNKYERINLLEEQLDKRNIDIDEEGFYAPHYGFRFGKETFTRDDLIRKDLWGKIGCGKFEFNNYKGIIKNIQKKGAVDNVVTIYQKALSQWKAEKDIQQ